MKKKKFLWLLALVVICTSCLLFACSPIKLGGGPKSTDTVYGNGGAAVVKGDYLYFANAFKNYEELGVNDNKYNDDSTKSYGIYRVKLNGFGTVDISDDGKGTPRGAELLVPLIGGYAKSGLYIGGNYLFYTTPYTVNLSGQSSVTTGYLRFERVKLDGTDRTVLSENAFTKDCDYNINHIDGTTYITIFGTKNPSSSNSDNNQNTSKDIYTIWSKDGSYGEHKITSSASSFATYAQEDIYYNKSINDINKYIYYTKSADSKYSLYRKAISNNGNEEPLIINSSEEIKLITVKNDRVYFKQDNVLYSCASKNNFDDINKRTKYTSAVIADDATSGITDYVILEDTAGTPIDRGIIAVRNDNSKYSVAHYNGTSAKALTSFANRHDSSKQINIIFTKGSQIFYTIQDDENKILYSYDYTLPDSEDNHSVVIYNFSSSVDEKSITFDYDNERVFFFGKVDYSNQKLDYLQFALLEENPYKDSENKSVANYIGKLDAGDIKKEEEDK